MGGLKQAKNSNRILKNAGDNAAIADAVADDNDMSIDKQDAIEALLGTWTWTTETSSDMGYYRGMAYVAVHFMRDPLQIYGCRDPTCIEADNQICQPSSSSSGTSTSPTGQSCVDTTSNRVQSSDVSAFFHFGFEVDTGFPWRSYNHQNTTGWLGPYNLVLASKDDDSDGKHRRLMTNNQDDEASSSLSLSSSSSSTSVKAAKKTTIVTSEAKFVSRYVDTIVTDLLHPPTNCSIISAEDFDFYAGGTAVQTTLSRQRSIVLPNLTNATIVDPYEDFHSTCDHGDVQPILPVFEIQVQRTQEKKEEKDDGKDLTTKKKKNDDDDEKDLPPKYNVTGWRFEYPILSMPDSKSDLYKIWPSLHKHLPDFPLTGPYCMGGDAHRAYTMTAVYDSLTTATATATKKKAHSLSTKSSSLLGGKKKKDVDGGEATPWKLTKGCVEGYPCFAHDNDGSSSNSSSIPSANPSKPASASDTIVQAVFTYGFYFLLLACLISVAYNWFLSRQVKQLREEQQQQQQQQNERQANAPRGGNNRRRRRRQVAATSTDGTSADGQLRQPLLSNEAGEQVDASTSVSAAAPAAAAENATQADADDNNQAPAQGGEGKRSSSANLAFV